jgi:hypothetical protein
VALFDVVQGDRWLLQSRSTGRVTTGPGPSVGFRFGLADGESGSAATRPVSASKTSCVIHEGAGVVNGRLAVFDVRVLLVW